MRIRNIVLGLGVILIVGCGGGSATSTNVNSNTYETTVDNHSSTNIDTTTNDIIVDNNPTKPINLKSYSMISNITLVWDKSRDKDGYAINQYSLVYKTIDEQNWSEEIIVNEESYNIDNLLPNTIYQFKIRAKDIEGNYSEYSKVLNVKTLEVPSGKIIVLVHGLNSGASTWSDLAPKLSREMGVEDGSYINIGMKMSINSGEECWDANWINEQMDCNELQDINDKEPFRKSQAYGTIFGLDQYPRQKKTK